MNSIVKINSKSVKQGFRLTNHPWLTSTCPPRRPPTSVLGMLNVRYFNALGIVKAKKLIPGYGN